MSGGYSREVNVQNVSYFASEIFELSREEIFLNLFRKLVHIKIFQIRRNIVPKYGSPIGYG